MNFYHTSFEFYSDVSEKSFDKESLNQKSDQKLPSQSKESSKTLTENPIEKSKELSKEAETCKGFGTSEKTNDSKDIPNIFDLSARKKDNTLDNKSYSLKYPIEIPENNENSEISFVIDPEPSPKRKKNILQKTTKKIR